MSEQPEQKIKRRRLLLQRVLLVLGGGLVTLGMGMIYPPLAPITLGLALVAEVLTTRGDA